MSGPTTSGGTLRGVTFSKQFPSTVEPLRGLFVAEQVLATRDSVDWRVIAPVPYVPRVLAGLLDKPYVRGDGDLSGIPVLRPRYPVLPRRLLYTTVAPAMACFARRAWREVLGSHRPAFVHAHALYPSGSAARRLTRGTVPYIVSIHGSDLYTNMVRPAWAAEVRATLAGAAAVVCVSTSLARDAISLAGSDPARTLVIPDTYDESRFAPRDYLPHAGPVRFVSVGRLVEVKGHDVLLHAFASATAAGLDATLEIVGGGPERESLEALVLELGVSDRVRFSGPLGGDELADALAAADAFVLASRREGFGVAIIEALAMGLPVLATRSGGPEDIVGPDDGVLVPSGDVEALASALPVFAGGLARFDRRAIAARVAERYGRDSVGRDLVEVYRTVIAGGTFESFKRVG